MSDLLPSKKFRCIVADPPWEIDMEGGSDARTQVKLGKWSDPRQDNSKIRALEYPQMTVEEITDLQIPAEKDAHLYIWTINKYIEATYVIARAWGFEPVCLLTWIKSPMGIGMGGTYCSNTEFVLFCRKGNLRAKRKVDTRWWGWPRGKHSAKPEQFQTIVESVSPGPYIELFARRKREGWTSWGNEIVNDVELESSKL
jgi:N6-adenosine-specific RNA methylase IME4